MGTRDRWTSRRIAAHLGPHLNRLWVEQGPKFAATAASSSLLSLMPVAIFSIVYSLLAQRLQMRPCALCGLGVFLLSLFFLQRLALPFWQTWIIEDLAISLGLICTPNKRLWCNCA
jgi:hypothetical protein